MVSYCPYYAKRAFYIPPRALLDKERPIDNTEEPILVNFDIWVVKKLPFSMCDQAPLLDVLTPPLMQQDSRDGGKIPFDSRSLL